MVAVSIQYFRSVIAVELAVTGALLFQVWYFAPRPVSSSRAAAWVRHWSQACEHS